MRLAVFWAVAPGSLEEGSTMRTNRIRVSLPTGHLESEEKQTSEASS